MDQMVDSEASILVRRRSRRWMIAGAVVVGIGAAIAWLTVRAGRDAAQAAAHDLTPPPLVTVLAPVRREFTSTVSLTGLISARNDLPIGNEGDAARITQIFVDAGATVHKGQVLARLNATTATSVVDNAEASLEEARASAALAAAEWARARQGVDLFSKEEVDQRRAAAISAQAKVKAAEAQVADARGRLAHTVIRAPADGLVLTRTAEVGQIAVPGVTVLFHLARDGQIEMRGQVAEVDMPRLAVGQKAEVRLDGVARAFTGTVWQVGSVIDPATRQGTVRIALRPADRDLRPGAFARADIRVDRTPGVLLPQTAVLTDERGTYVLIVDRDDKVARRRVRVAAARSDGLLVGAGLRGTERVVAVAGAFLRPGEAVSTARAGAAASP